MAGLQALQDAHLERYVILVAEAFGAAKEAVEEAKKRGCHFEEPIRPRRRRLGCRRRSGAKLIAQALDQATQDLADEFKRWHLKVPRFARGDFKANLAMDSVLEQVQKKILDELNCASEQQSAVNVTAVLAAMEVARRFALQALSECSCRLTLPAYNATKKTTDSIDCPSLLTDVSSAASTISGSTLVSSPGAETPSFNSSGLSATTCRLSRPRAHASAIPYDLSIKVLPTGAPWQWCEGACRARTGRGPLFAALAILHSPATTSSTSICAHCPRFAAGPLRTAVQATSDRAERLRRLDFALRCHALVPVTDTTPETPTETGSVSETVRRRATWVCHACFGRNPYDAAAGPMTLEALDRHYAKRHAKRAEEGEPRKRTPRPLTVFAPWEAWEKARETWPEEAPANV